MLKALSYRNMCIRYSYTVAYDVCGQEEMDLEAPMFSFSNIFFKHQPSHTLYSLALLVNNLVISLTPYSFDI